MNVDGTVQQARVGVVVHRAESLVGLSASGTSNPFVSVSVGATVLSTPVVQNSTNPTFEAAFNFPECPIPTILTLRVFHKEAGGVESPLGSATLTLFSPSAMTRRQVQLGHGGSVVLSQKARDGCGSLDISYEVVAPTSYKATASEQRKSVDDDLPSFLRDDAGAETLTSAFTAFSQPPPPPAAAIPKPPEFGAVPPPPPAAAIPKPPEFGAVPPPPPAAAIPKPPEFGAVPPPPPAAAIPKPPEFGTVAPPVPVVVPSTSGQSFIASAAFANEDSSETSPPPSSSTMPDTGGTSHSSHRGYSSASSPNSTNHTQLQRQQMASASSTGATSTSLHTSSNHSSTAPPPPLQAQKEPPLHGVDKTSRAPSGSASVEPTAKDSDKSQKKVRIATNAKDRPTSAGTAANTKPPLRQPSESGRGRSCSSVSPTREARRTSSAQGGRSSPYVHGPVVKKVNNFTAQGTTLLSAARRSANFQVPTIYQYPEELLAAASQGDVAVFQRLREEDPQLSRGFEKVRDYSGRTILHIAAWYGHVQVLKILLQPTPVAPLLELRALRSVNGNTILHSAAQGGRVDAVQWLRFSTAAASLIGQRNARGITATECAREAGFSNVALMLAETM